MNATALARARLTALTLPRGSAQVAELLKNVLFGLALASIAAFVVAALFRLSYPYPLEPTEGMSLEQVERILRGQPLYVEPTLQHVPLIYGPSWFLITEPGVRWLAELDGALGQQRYGYVVVPSDLCCDVEGRLNRNGYSLVGPLFPPGDEYWLWTTNSGRIPNDLQLFVSRAVRSGSR